MSAASGGIRLGRGVGPVRSGGRSVSWVCGMGCGDWRAGSAEGLDRSWVGGRARSELGRRVGFMVDGLTQIGDGGKERNSEGRWRRKCEERGGWDEMKEKEEKNKEKNH